MLYWKTFLLMCIACWLTTLSGAVLIGLGIAGVVRLSGGLWVFLVLLFMAFVMASVICGFIMNEEIKERREERDYRKRFGRS